MGRIPLRLVSLALFLAAFTPASEDVSGWTLERSKAEGARAEAIETVTEPVRDGATAMRFTIKAGDCVPDDCAADRERVELKSREHEHEGDERWYAWSFQLPEDFASIWPARQFIAQFHQEDERPAMLFSLEPDGLRLDSQFFPNGALLIPAAELRGRWHDVAMHVQWSHDDGLVDIHVDGKSVFRQRGPNLSGEVYFKIGLYRAHLARNRDAARLAQTLLVDAVRRWTARPGEAMP
jgi:hypothetical protein